MLYQVVGTATYLFFCGISCGLWTLSWAGATRKGHRFRELDEESYGRVTRSVDQMLRPYPQPIPQSCMRWIPDFM
jgi:hypothetical protein